ncbi:MAG: class I SAM-dependent methyltransferase [Deltaproteobacteria bacterium]|jgi:D-alanine-D-alanine ligase|nr:class I SAM-dependent methyltransferase [Deltaproteobacteria bacterium]
MPIEVDPDWWKTLFDDVYLLTDARSVGDDSLTRLEVDVVCELLPLEAGHKILDLCGGQGRHSLELCRRGFEACTLLDYSRALTAVAREKAQDDKFPLKVVRCDARQIDLGSDHYNHVLIMGNSLGYIQESDADQRILAEAMRVLQPGGWLLLDVTDGAAVKRSFNPNAWHEVGEDTVVCRQRELRNDAVRARELVISKKDGLIRDRTYAVRLYEPQTILSLLETTGFRQIKIHTDFSPHRFEGDYGFMNRRMLAIGRKPLRG